MTDIASLLDTLPAGVRLVAVSKTRTLEEILDVYNQGHKVFGENRVQELVEKPQKLIMFKSG